MGITADAVLRILVATALGAVIGAEREASEQPAGLRTHIAVCLGAGLFGVVSTLGFTEFESERAATNIQIDVTRVASQVVVGIGFLGASMVFRQGTSIKNLTTAASLWVTAAIGLAAGVGDVGTAAVATGIWLVALVALLPVRAMIRSRAVREKRELQVVLRPGVAPGALITAFHELDGVKVDHMQVGLVEGAYSLIVHVKAGPGVPLADRLMAIVERDDIASLGDRPGAAS